jgi:polyhydroxyalkanoate synthesis regulator phasin
MDSLLKRAAVFGLGLLDLTEEKARELADEIVRRGEAHEQDADALAGRLMSHARCVSDSVRQTIGRQVAAAAEGIDLDQPADLAAVVERLDALEARIASLEAREGPHQEER